MLLARRQGASPLLSANRTIQLLHLLTQWRGVHQLPVAKGSSRCLRLGRESHPLQAALLINRLPRAESWHQLRRALIPQVNNPLQGECIPCMILVFLESLERRYVWCTVIRRGSNHDEHQSRGGGQDSGSSSKPPISSSKELSRPLAEIMRPLSIEDYVGQESVIGKNAILRTILESGEVPSLIFWGPPGCGKVAFIVLFISWKVQSFINLSDWYLYVM